MHELTEKVINRVNITHYLPTENEIDSIITAYLKECADKLQNDHNQGKDFMPREILGLSEQNLDKPEPKKASEEWCEHCMTSREELTTFKMVEGYIGWNFCPICGTPRPQPKSLREKVREILEQPFEGGWINTTESKVDKILSSIEKL